MAFSFLTKGKRDGENRRNLWQSLNVFCAWLMLDSVLLSFRKRSKIDLDQQMLFFFHFEYQDRRTSALTRSKKLLGTTGKRVTDVLSTYRIARASSRKLPAPEGGGACLKKRLHPGFGSYIFRRTGCPHQSEFGPGEYVFDSRRSEFAPCIEIWHSEEGRWLSS